MGWTYTPLALADIIGVEPSAEVAHAPAFTSVCTDTRILTPGQAFFALSGEHFDGNQFVPAALAKGAAVAVASEAIKGSCIVVDSPLAALQRFATHHRRQYSIPVLAITGSCGKTSAKDFTAAVLAAKYRVAKTRGNLNNDIGCPMSLLGIQPDTNFAVIEMGANHVGEIAQLCTFAAPTEVAVTMVGPSHLEGFGSIEKVAEAKSEIVRALDVSGRFYINADDPWCRAMADSFAGEKVWFGKEGDVSLRDCSFDDSGELRLDIDPVGVLRLPLPVRAQAYNVMLAIAVGLKHGITEFEEPLREACAASTRGRVLRVGPLEILDDTYNANPASMRAALESLAARPGKGRRLAALGGMLELGDTAAKLHYDIGKAAAQCGVDRLYARGPHACDMIEGARQAGLAHAEILEEHAAIAGALYEEARPGDVLLVKGSRGMRMDEVIKALREKYPAPLS